ncbi:MAG: hypothetical protein ACI4RF_07430 [Eubacterium sp.]
MGEKIEQKQQIKKYEQTIVNTIAENKKRISKLNIIIYILFAVVEIFSIYFFTLAATPSDAMGLLMGLVLVTQINSLVFGLTNIEFKFKTIYPWIATIAFIPSNFLYWGREQAFEIAMFYGLIHLIFSYIFMIIGTGITKLISKALRKIRQKRERE